MGFFCEPGHELAGRGRKDLGFAVATEVRRRAMLSVDHTRRREVPRVAAGAAPAGAGIFEQIQRYNLCDAPFRLVTVILRHGTCWKYRRQIVLHSKKIMPSGWRVHDALSRDAMMARGCA